MTYKRLFRNCSIALCFLSVIVSQVALRWDSHDQKTERLNYNGKEIFMSRTQSAVFYGSLIAFFLGVGGCLIFRKVG
jgi:hypothetical protein